MNLTITPSSINTITATACDNYTWNNQTYNQSGIYTGTTANCITEKLNLTITPSTIYFADADNDGFGNPTITQLACSQPIGYVANSNDCNDANANINPTAPEICDGIDNNCNGQIDEGCNVIATQLVGATCGAVMQNTYLTIAATQIVGATGYRFRVTNLTTNSVQIIDRVPFFWFQFNTVNDLTYNTNYSIEVMVQIAGIWPGNYGTACLVTTPSISGTGPKAATLVSSQCGSTLASISTTFGSNNLSGVTGYRFRLTNTNDGTVQVLDRNVHWLSLNMFQIFNYGVTYTVEVAIKTTGTTYSAYGNICNITAPAIPSIQNVCDTQIPKSFINFGTKSSIAVTSYKFEITNTLTNSVQTLIKPVHYFNFKELSGIMPNTVYSIRVAVKTGLTFSEFSVACNITSPLANREIFAQGVLQESITENFEVLVLPNPFTDNFALNITSSSTEKIEIKIFDMIGKLLESRELQFDDIQNFSIGNNYPSGVYSVIVTQNDNFKTIRVIKR